MYQMSNKRVYTEGTPRFSGTLSAGRAVVKKIIEKVGIIMIICDSHGLSLLLNQTELSLELQDQSLQPLLKKSQTFFKMLTPCSSLIILLKLDFS